jgi:hypothetical protein
MTSILNISQTTTDAMRLIAMQPHPNGNDLMFLHGGSLWSLTTSTGTIAKVSEPTDRPEFISFLAGPSSNYWAAYVISSSALYGSEKYTITGSEHGETTLIKIKSLQ